MYRRRKVQVEKHEKLKTTGNGVLTKASDQKTSLTIDKL